MAPVEFLFLVCAGAGFIALEKLLPLHPHQKTLRAGWRVDLMHVFLSGAAIRVGTTWLTIAASFLALSAVPEAWREAVRAQPDWLEFIELLVLSDLCFYAAHRLCHAVPFLWRFHAVHHSSERMDWLAAYRLHPVDQIMHSTMVALPAIVLGFSPGVVVVFAIVYRLHSPLQHANLRFNFGPLGALIATPQFHHWHHAEHPEAYDHNFAGQLSLIDRLFGTAYRPGKAMPERYGLSDPLPEGYAAQLIHPFRSAGEPAADVPAPAAEAVRA